MASMYENRELKVDFWKTAWQRRESETDKEELGGKKDESEDGGHKNQNRVKE